MSARTVDKLIRPQIRAMQAYQIPPSAGLVKLDAMENPYSLPAPLQEQWLDKLGTAQINRYPDPSASQVSRKLLAQADLPESCDVLLGNGSDELIQIIIQALDQGAGPVMSVTPTFIMYELLARISGKEYVAVALNPDFSLNIDVMLKAIEKHQPACLFLAYPNNPTGNLFAQHEIDRILAVTKGLVVIDEAYLPFAGVSQIAKLKHNTNVLVMRTLSKLGLAGLRLGMLFGDQRWLEQLNKIRLPYNINSLTQLSVEFALDNSGFFEDSAERIIQERERVTAQLSQLPNLQVYPSDANFILFRPATIPASQIFEGLLERQILIKMLHKPDSLLQQCLRVTIGTEKENNLFLESIQDIIRKLA